jgi:hypothetical protein
MEIEDQSYIVEKADHAIEFLAQMQKYINEYDNLNEMHPCKESIREILSNDIHMALRELTKILKWSGNGGKWDNEDVDILLKDVKTGLRVLYVKYGIWEETNEEKDN